MKYDDAEYYFLNFETDLPNENGGRHMGVFLEWAILRGLAGSELMAHADTLQRGEITGLDILFDDCDGKLTDDDLSDEGNAFAEAFYERYFMRDYMAAVNAQNDASADEVFGADLTRQRRACVMWMLDRRYSDWLRTFGLLDKQVLLDRCLAAIHPVAEAEGFPRVTATLSGSHLVCATFMRSGQWGAQRFDVIVLDNPEWFYGVRIVLNLHLHALYETIYAEKELDQGLVTSLQSCAEIPLSRIAEGWSGPIQDYNAYESGFWVFREGDIAPLVDWLAMRLRTFTLPTLRSLDSVDALALAYGTRPMSASAIHHPTDPYAALLAAEQARHPRLAAMLMETEEAILALATRERSRDQRGALALIERIRERSKWWMN